MLKVTTRAGRTLRILFAHSSPNGQPREGAGALRLGLDASADIAGRRLTLCEVSQVAFSGTSDGESSQSFYVLGQGVAVCHPTDTFCKATGRKIALAGALTAASTSDTEQPDSANYPLLSREERADVWDAYRALNAPQASTDAK